MPAKLGRVVEVYEAAGSDKMFFHIQDVHAHPEAQRNSAAILEHLHQQYGLSLVTAEGASERVDPSILSEFPEPGVRRTAADLFMDNGELTGEEYAAIVQQLPLDIWGIEEPPLYYVNGLYYLANLQIRDEALDFVGQMENTIEALMQAGFPELLLELLAQRRSFDQGPNNLETYAGYLRELSRRLNLESGAAQAVDDFVTASQLQQSMDAEAFQGSVERLTQALVKHYSARQDQGALTSLLLRMKQMKERGMAGIEFYKELLEGGQVAVASGLKLAAQDLAQLKAYTQSLELLEGLQLSDLGAHLDQLAQDSAEALCENDAQRQTLNIHARSAQLRKLFELHFGSQEWHHYTESKQDYDPRILCAELHQLCASRNIPFPESLPVGVIRIQAYLKIQEKFYETVLARDQALFENALERLEENEASSAALITGGFHTEGLTQRLKDAGYSYVVIAPRVTQTANEERYLQMLQGERLSASQLNGLAASFPFENAYRLIHLTASGLSNAYSDPAVQAEIDGAVRFVASLGEPLAPVAGRLGALVEEAAEGGEESRLRIATALLSLALRAAGQGILPSSPESMLGLFADDDLGVTLDFDEETAQYQLTDLETGERVFVRSDHTEIYAGVLALNLPHPSDRELARMIALGDSEEINKQGRSYWNQLIVQLDTTRAGTEGDSLLTELVSRVQGEIGRLPAVVFYQRDEPRNRLLVVQDGRDYWMLTDTGWELLARAREKRVIVTPRNHPVLRDFVDQVLLSSLGSSGTRDQ
ncbi:MAG: hypothetical protein JW937_05360, partial [Candidatus Omnitrophica bacterium]|nr:hypothetical protein [Candidatus Omnitrophota bacterium]